MSSSNSRQDTPANTDMTQISRKPMRRWLWYSAAGFLVFDGLAILHHLLFAPDTINGLKIIGDINNTLGWLLAVAFCISRLPHSWWKKETRSTITSPLQTAQQRIPLWIAGAFLINTIERGAYMYYDMIHVAPVLDWPSIVLLLRYPFLLLAVISLYRHSLSLIARLRLALDGFLILTALITFSWYFFLGPIILEVHENAFEKLEVIAYPLADLVLCFYLFQLSFHNSEPTFRFVRRLFSLGLLGIVVADLFDISQLLQKSFVLPLMQSLVLCLGYILIALAVQALHNINTKQSTHRDEVQDEEAPRTPDLSPFLWQSLLPSAFVPAVLLFMVIIWFTSGTNSLATGVYLTGVALVIQLVVRQILVMYETFISNRALQSVQKELHKKNLALTQANLLLEEQAQQLTTAYKQQNQANKLKDQFLLNVNHELRTPLTEMHGYLELLHAHQGSIDAKTHERFLSHALNGSHELQRLVNTILDALRSEHACETLHCEEFSLISIVQEVVELFEPRKREAYQLDLLIPAELTVYADQQYLRQILTNLLSNAFKYSPPQTTISIGAQEVPITNEAPHEAPYVHIWVQDCGPGIPPQDMTLLFNKFFRLEQHQKSSIRGTGLGLYICKQLVEAMDGRIWVESSGYPGKGTRFCFTLPFKRC
jgi:signal transduction histidine kinase